MEIDVKGHSGCQIDVVREGKDLFIYKSTRNPKYLNRLVLQAEKQKSASLPELQHIRVPKIHNIKLSDNYVSIKMDYVYSRNFIEFFEQAGFEQVNYFIEAIIKYLEFEIKQSSLTLIKPDLIIKKFEDVKSNSLMNSSIANDTEIKSQLERSAKIFYNLPEILIPIGVCHGDLTFSNILFNGNNYYLIDFLDSFIESPLLDIVKLRQDTSWYWSQLMYIHKCDTIRLHIAFEYIDKKINDVFNNYDWYRRFYRQFQLLNFLRILPYVNDSKVIEYLKITINEQLEAF